jgi:hypothetical protein
MSKIDIHFYETVECIGDPKIVKTRLTQDGKLPVASLKEKFGVATLEEIDDGDALLIGADEHGVSLLSFTGNTTIKVTGESKCKKHSYDVNMTTNCVVGGAFMMDIDEPPSRSKSQERKASDECYEEIQRTLSGSPALVQIDDISVRGPYLPRRGLLNRLLDHLDAKQFVAVMAPAGYGKTSLATLLRHHFDTVDLSARVYYVQLRVGTDDEPFERLAKVGIDVRKEEIVLSTTRPRVIIYFDECHLHFHNSDFWTTLIEGSSALLASAPARIQFVFSATYSLAIDQSPVHFKSMPMLRRSDFVLADQESVDFLRLPSPHGLNDTLQSDDDLKRSIITLCGGHVCALRLVVTALNDMSKLGPMKANDSLQMLYSPAIFFNLGRIFGEPHMGRTDTSLTWFAKIFYMLQVSTIPAKDRALGDDALVKLVRAGILKPESTSLQPQFTSPLAQGFFYTEVYPRRSPTNPESLRDLVRSAIQFMSASVLQQAGKTSFPKEAVFQHEFHYGLIRATASATYVCPELSQILGSQKNITGEIDFYVNLHGGWGIELLVQSRGMKEHVSRFDPTTTPAGKYVRLGVKDYTVIDFRNSRGGEEVSVNFYKKAITVFFPKTNFAKCTVRYHDDQKTEKLTLMP